MNSIHSSQLSAVSSLLTAKVPYSRIEEVTADCDCRLRLSTPDRRPPTVLDCARVGRR